jgi:hypothetical protein
MTAKTIALSLILTAACIIYPPLAGVLTVAAIITEVKL